MIEAIVGTFVLLTFLSLMGYYEVRRETTMAHICFMLYLSILMAILLTL